MQETERDGAAVRFPPPAVYAIALIVGGLLHVFVWPLSLGLSTGARVASGLLVGALGVALVSAAFGLFRRIGQDPAPWTSTPDIVSSGVYRFTRNPMYIGMALIQTGIGLGWSNGWLLLLVPVVLAVVQRIAIVHEEAYLERKFGETYLAYKRSVRRWL